MEDKRARIKGEYHPRNSRASALYQMVEDYWEDFVGCYEDRYEKTYGYFRDVIRKAFFRFLDCGDLHHGFARIRCSHCKADMLLAFSCKSRYFCPSCHMKRSLIFSTHLEEEVLGSVPIRHWVFTIPKMLRPCFRHKRKLLALLSRCAWECVEELCPHIHALASDGLFLQNGDFLLLPLAIDEEKMEQLFQYKVLSMLRKEGKITGLLMEKLLSWRHSGFHCHRGGRIEAGKPSIPWTFWRN
ncbi:MAG: transposase zinc-binding domain-containing protein [Armatimonadetes bacterium]|nr:transposase zinc-binding domain-containing protein [Armatimonadota bacterium]